LGHLDSLVLNPQISDKEKGPWGFSWVMLSHQFLSGS
jgi:hypothetical protein